MKTENELEKELQQAKEELIRKLPWKFDIVGVLFNLCDLKDRADDEVSNSNLCEDDIVNLLKVNQGVFMEVKYILEEIYNFRRKEGQLNKDLERFEVSSQA